MSPPGAAGHPQSKPRGLLDLAETLRVGARLPVLQARLVCALLADMAEGGECPSVAGLADRLDVHRTTVHQALVALRQKGFLTETVETVVIEKTIVLRRTRRRLTISLPNGVSLP